MYLIIFLYHLIEYYTNLYEMSQLIDGKCFLCASFLSKPQNTWTIPRVADVTGSEKSPPGGDTAPTMDTEPKLQ